VTKKRTNLAELSYSQFFTEVAELLEQARKYSARSVNAIMTHTYWEVGRRIVEHEQHGKKRAVYGEALIERLALDLTGKFGRGFSQSNLWQMRDFYLAWPILQTTSGESRPSKPISVDTPKFQTLSGLSGEHQETRLQRFPLPWSHYVRLLAVKGKEARVFYETEALPEYSESALEDALIHRLEQFLLELGNDFSFIARQKRLRIGDEWYRVDLLFFHRRLRCLVIIDLKIGRFAHADAGQMNLYLNYAREHWTLPGENPPIGLILSSEKNEAVAHYALGNLRNKVLSSEYKLALPDEKKLAEEIARTRKSLIQRKL
jgi:nuclease YhcG-like protein/uncharacterized protein DUF1016